MYRDPDEDIQVNVQVALEDITKYLSAFDPISSLPNAIQLNDGSLLLLGSITNKFYIAWYDLYGDDQDDGEHRYFSSLMDALDYCFEQNLIMRN